MAQMIQEKFSAQKHLDIADRHVHLSQRYPGADFLVQDIKEPIQRLEDVAEAVVAKGKVRSFAYDTVVFLDRILDNEAQNVFEGCNKIDRESGSFPILKKIFLTGRITDIKEAPLMQEPLIVKELIERMYSLGPTHPIAAYIPGIAAKAAESEKAIAEYDKQCEELALLKAREQIAKRNLRDQYRFNYLHAQEKLGPRNAELVFPTISIQSKSTEPEESEEQPAAA
jgi:hypothetical protein